MSISVNGQSRVPPGFRFHPTEEELLLYYLKKKAASQKIDLNVICAVDLNKMEPWDIQEKCKIGSTPQNDWYFFSHKDKKYATGSRTNRATAAGFWKATGRDKMIRSNGKRIGMRKTLVFYTGRAPHGHKSEWIMHEYRLDDGVTTNVPDVVDGEIAQEEGWVVCRMFKKKNQNHHHHHHHHKCPGSPMNSSSALTPHKKTDTPTIVITAAMPNTTTADQYSPSSSGALEQVIFKKIRKDNDDEPVGSPRSSFPVNPRAMINRTNYISPLDRSMKLPPLESPNSICYQPTHSDILMSMENEVLSDEPNPVDDPVTAGLTDWAAFDRLVASHLNGQNIGETSKLLACFTDQNLAFCTPSDEVHHDSSEINKSSSSNKVSLGCNNCNEIDLWSFTRSSSPSSFADPLCHVANPPI
ncbi:hypothetical protein Ancab_038059 [Ancistrocladus abbreviatus]